MQALPKITFFTVLWLSLTLIVACAHKDASFPKAAAPPVYDYPINNAYAATIIGTPAEMKVRYPDAIEADEEKLQQQQEEKQQVLVILVLLFQERFQL